MAKGNGKAPAQEPLIPGLEDEPSAEPAEQATEALPEDVHAAAAAAEDGPAEEAPAEPEARVLELANTTAGCWKVVDGEERVELSDAEWRQELAHLFRKEAPAPRA